MKSAIAVAERNRDGTARLVCPHGKVEFAIVVKVGGGNRTGGSGEFNKHPVLKSAVAITKKQADIQLADIGRNQIERAVAVEVAAGDLGGGVPHSIIARWRQSAVRLAEQGAFCPILN